MAMTINLSFLTGDCLQYFEAHRDLVSSVDFTRDDGSCFMTASYDGACRIYDLLLGKCLRTILHPLDQSNPPVGYARFSPNGRYLLASYLNSTIRLWDFTNTCAKPVKTYREGYSNRGYSIPFQFVRSGGDRRTKWIVSGTDTGRLVTWDFQTRELMDTVDASEQATLDHTPTHGTPSHDELRHRPKDSDDASVVVGLSSHPYLPLLASAVRGDSRLRLWAFNHDEHASTTGIS